MSLGSIKQKTMNKNSSGFIGIEYILVIVVVGLVGFVGAYTLHVRNEVHRSSLDNKLSSSTSSKAVAPADKATASAILQSQSGSQAAKSPGSTPTKSSTQVTAQKTPTSATPAPTANPAPNTTNCLPQNPSPYATYYINMTNSQYLQTNSYVYTTKLYAALQFAGLINTINTRQYVVLAMDDSAWSSFTPTQLNWMNASPANMRSVLGWQVITSCITWDGVNPVKDLSTGATLSVNTLNGPVTFTSKSGGIGTFGSGSVGIWDWFTSNGSVTIAGFVNKTSIP